MPLCRLVDAIRKFPSKHAKVPFLGKVTISEAAVELVRDLKLNFRYVKLVSLGVFQVNQRAISHPSQCRPDSPEAPSVSLILSPISSPSTKILTPTDATKLRPSLTPRVLPSTTALSQYRYESNLPTEDPKKRAQTIIDALPGNSLASKTAILSAGTGVSVWAISNELYVLNEESVVAFCLLTVFYGIFQYGGPMYKEWSKNTEQKFKDILNTARAGHAEAVKTRIEDVKPLSGVVEITKQLFEVSKVN